MTDRYIDDKIYVICNIQLLLHIFTNTIFSIFLYFTIYFGCIKVLNMILISTSLTRHDVEYLCHMFREHLKVAYKLENTVWLSDYLVLYSYFPCFLISMSIFSCILKFSFLYIGIYIYIHTYRYIYIHTYTYMQYSIPTRSLHFQVINVVFFKRLLF